ncbi:IS66 family insertion sequence hypothetical protein [Salmonella enterica]|nr:IS66 family insertion sequence hypothetical protein [Salmonella enterica]
MSVRGASPVPVATLQPSAPSVGCETLNASCEVAFKHGTFRLNDSVSENLLAMLIRELKR